MYWHHHRDTGLAKGVFFIGLAVLLITGWWWPGILFVIGASALAGNGWRVAPPLFGLMMFGLLFTFGFKLLPLFLILGGIAFMKHKKAFHGWDHYNDIDGEKRKNDYSEDDALIIEKAKRGNGYI